MPSGFKAILHDRNSGASAPVVVRPGPGVLFIELADSRILDWTLPDIDSARALDDGSVILQNGRRFLEVTEPSFRSALERSFPKNKLFQQTFFDRIGVGGCLISFALIILPIWGLYSWLLPVLAERAAQKVPSDVEKQIGEAWFQSVGSIYRVDSAKTRIVQQFYDALAFESDYDIRISVVNEPVVNAFALPGGHIVVFDSMIGIMDAPEQLAALLAHEASHIQWKHSTRTLFRGLANNLLFSIVLGNYGDVSTIVAQHGEQLAGLAYSRSLEQEADEKGLELMAAARIPLRGMPDLFRKMNTTAADGELVPTFLSTHPGITDRIQTTEDLIRSKNAGAGIISPELQQIWQELKQR
ncbi:MAG: M48 family metallopeptidase [Lewinellaceae bacterium]|nr:M48 family metallopeptidase [Lewinellaceae bacterium]